MDLTEARNKIDAIDDKIAALYSERMDLCREIGKEKARLGKTTDVPEREKEIVNRLAEKLPDDRKVFLKQLYGTVFTTSKAYQNQFIGKHSRVAEEVRQASEKQQKPPVSASVACQGAAGAYSGIAAEKAFDLTNVSYFKTFDAVFNAVEKGLCRYGVLPIENSNTGSILPVYDLMQKYRFFIVKSVRVQIKHALVAKPGADISKIKTVLSHEQGILQCANFVKSVGAEAKIVENTAVAARTVAESDDETVAAIASEESAKVYGLSVLRSNVQDNGNNYTRFIVISKTLEIYKGADRISVMLSAEHTPGSLSRVLDRFAALNLNVTKIESRPIVNSDFEFLFYFDFEGDVTDESVLSLISDLDLATERFVFLGAYRETV